MSARRGNDVLLRDATNDDAPGIIDLVGRVYAEYPGCVLDVDGEEPYLRTPADSFSAFWVLERDGEIVGTCACHEHSDTGGRRAVELKKLYLDPSLRGTGWGSRLVALVEDWARERDIPTVDLWSDTRFETAHRVYTHLGYVRQPQTRELYDKSATVEYYYRKPLRSNA